MADLVLSFDLMENWNKEIVSANNVTAGCSLSPQPPWRSDPKRTGSRINMAGIVTKGYFSSPAPDGVPRKWASGKDFTDKRLAFAQHISDQEYLDLQQLYAQWRFKNFTQTTEFRARGGDNFRLNGNPRPGKLALLSVLTMAIISVTVCVSFC